MKEACDESLPYFSLGVAQRKKANRNLRFTMQAEEVGCARLIPTSWPAFIRDTWRFDKKKKKKIGKEWVNARVRPRVALFVECAIQWYRTVCINIDGI